MQKRQILLRIGSAANRVSFRVWRCFSKSDSSVLEPNFDGVDFESELACEVVSFLSDEILAFFKGNFELLELEFAEDSSLTRSGRFLRAFLVSSGRKWETVLRGKAENSVDSEGEVD